MLCELMDCSSGAPASMWHHLKPEGFDCMRICFACYHDLHGETGILSHQIDHIARGCPDCRDDVMRAKARERKLERDAATR